MDEEEVELYTEEDVGNVTDYYVDQKIVWMPIGDIIPYDHNVKLHENMLGFLKNNIKRIKFRTPIYVDRNNVIIAGHARRLAAMALGMKRVPVIVADDLSEEDVKLWRLTDNRLTELSDYDMDMLGLEVQELKDLGIELSDFGLDFDFEDPLAGWEDEGEEDGTSDEGCEFDTEDESLMKDFEGKGFIQSGDIVLMGNHRLICGDSTDPSVIKRVLDGEVADVCITSPPYNIGHMVRPRTPREGAKYIYDDDSKDEAQYEEFLHDILGILLDNSEEVFFNIGFLSGSKTAFVHLMNSYLGNLKDMLYWKKSNPVPAVKEGVVSSAVEPILCFGKNGSRQFRHKHGVWYGVIEGSAANGNAHSDVHRATFPLYLPTELIDVFTEEGDIVLDPFGGTGTTLIACQDTDRRCRMVEIVPEYCDIIVERYVHHTGDTKIAVIRDNKRLKYPLEG